MINELLIERRCSEEKQNLDPTLQQTSILGDVVEYAEGTIHKEIDNINVSNLKSKLFKINCKIKNLWASYS